ncbi:hypothetical protein TIFTF001_039858 [Ficus carica]|uniref:Uncharacterized protein n=1 Tax=Ficus carica TaxID=3494 RepID=A0AA87Z0E6_FICCA|nr:hypothetical protein TIFTF001_039858 [Ficus carica]
MMMEDNREGYPSYWTGSKAQGDSLLLCLSLESHDIGHSMLYVTLCYGMLWHVMNGLPPSTIPWLCTTVSNLPAISDAILWKAGATDCEMWDGHRHKF